MWCQRATDATGLGLATGLPPIWSRVFVVDPEPSPLIVAKIALADTAHISDATDLGLSPSLICRRVMPAVVLRHS